MPKSLDKRLAIIGAGKMGGALAGGIVRCGAMLPSNITLFDAHAALARDVAARSGCKSAATASAAAAAADIILIAVKPGVVPRVLTEIGSGISREQLVISIAAGVRIEKIESLLPEGVPVVRAMPNTAALVGEAATGLSAGNHAGPEHLSWAELLFGAIGTTAIVEERLLDAVTGLSGSGPAYVYLVIEALVDAGVKAGLTRDVARQLSAQTVYGAAKMVLETGEHPAKLKDDVTTPGGTTIAGLAVLERAGIRIALIDAVEAAAQRSKELS
jgi:pyrroline-5-carboxylate reductase